MAISYSDFRRIIVAIDPAVTSGENADDTGMVVVARGPHQGRACKLMELTGRCPGHGYVLADLTCHLSPAFWAKRAVKAYDVFQADRIIAEKNNGGDMVGLTIHAVRSGIPYTNVDATKGKRKRAEPVAALWEQGRAHFAVPCPELEDELTSWTQDSTWSPNRLDAMVWGFTALGLIGGQGDAFLKMWRGEIAKDASMKNEDKNLADDPRIKQLLRQFPKFGQKAESGAGKANCEHRWRGKRCVFCAAIKDF